MPSKPLFTWEWISLIHDVRKFWHQCLRRIISHPGSFFCTEVLGLPGDSFISSIIIVYTAFGLSGALHTLAGISSGMPFEQLGVFRFFFTQASGVIFERAVATVYRRYVRKQSQGESQRERSDYQTSLQVRTVAKKTAGYLWVAAFFIWSTPAWLYPQAAKPSAADAGSFLPFSVVKALRAM